MRSDIDSRQIDATQLEQIGKAVWKTREAVPGKLTH
jgi:hypothetical protein